MQIQEILLIRLDIFWIIEDHSLHHILSNPTNMITRAIEPSSTYEMSSKTLQIMQVEKKCWTTVLTFPFAYLSFSFIKSPPVWGMIHAPVLEPLVHLLYRGSMADLM